MASLEAEGSISELFQQMDELRKWRGLGEELNSWEIIGGLAPGL